MHRESKIAVGSIVFIVWILVFMWKPTIFGFGSDKFWSRCSHLGFVLPCHLLSANFNFCTSQYMYIQYRLFFLEVSAVKYAKRHITNAEQVTANFTIFPTSPPISTSGDFYVKLSTMSNTRKLTSRAILLFLFIQMVNKNNREHFPLLDFQYIENPTL